MEERNNMVREYLKEREVSERKYKSKADDMMANFNKKMKKLENSLSFMEEEEEKNITPGLCTISVQTQPMSTEDTGVQVDFENLNCIDIQEIIQAVTEDIEEAARNRYLKERAGILHDVVGKQNKIDSNEIHAALEVLENEITEQDDDKLRGKVNQLAEEFLKQHDNVTVNKAIVADYIQDGHPSDTLPEETRQQLDPFKTRYRREAKEIHDKRSKETERKLHTTLESLYEKCKAMEHSKNKLKDALQSLIETSPGIADQQTIENILEEVEEQENYDEQTAIEKALLKLGLQGEQQTISKKQSIKEALASIKETRRKEDDIRGLILPQFLDSKNMYWKQKMMEMNLKNKELVTEKENLLKEIQKGREGDDEHILTKKSQDKFYLSPLPATNPVLSPRVSKIEPRIGQNLLEHLTRGDLPDSQGGLQAVELVYYQERPVEDILQHYEKEIGVLGDDANRNAAVGDVLNLLAPGVTVETKVYNTLQEELKNVTTMVERSGCNHTEINQELETLKQKKSKMIQAEQELSSKREFLKVNMKTINKQVADKLVYAELQKQQLSHKNWLSEVDKQIGRLEDKISAQQHLATLDDNDQIASHVKDRISDLRRGLEKLQPFVSQNKKQHKTSQRRVPQKEEIDDILKQKEEFSKRLLEVENKIQEIITSEGYESSVGGSGTMENIEDVQFDMHSPTDSGGLSEFLSDQLKEAQSKLNEINNKLDSRNICTADYGDIEKVCRELSRGIRHIEKKLRKAPPPQTGGSNEITKIDREIGKLRKELLAKGVKDATYDKKNEDELMHRKSAAIENLKSMTGGVNSDQTISRAIRDLLDERDHTQKQILSLNDDIQALDDINLNLETAGHTSLDKRHTDINVEILDKKATNVNRMIAIANNRLSYFINLVKIKIREKLDEASKSKWENKERVSREEKQSLGKNLKEIVEDIQKTENDLEEITDYKVNGFYDDDIQENIALKTLVNQKSDLTAKLTTLEKNIDGGGDKLRPENLQKILQQKQKITEQLGEINERIEDQDVVLQQRLTQLKVIKKDLEMKLADCIEVEDLQQIVAELDKKEPSRMLNVREKEEEKVESELARLMRERQSVQQSIHCALKQSPHERAKIKKMNEVLENIDVSIFVQVDEVLAKLDSAPKIDSEAKMEVYDLLSTTANAFNFMRDQSELQEALEVARLKDETKTTTTTNNLQSVCKTREEIEVLEDLKKKMENVQQRDIGPQDLDNMKELKELNEKKLDKLLTKIKNLNKLVDVQRKLDRKVRRSQNPSLSDLEDISATTEKINTELKSIVQKYDSEQVKRDDVQAKVISGSKNTAMQKLNNVLEQRDKMLNQLFRIEREITHAQTSGARKRKLVDEKNVLTQQLETIDESIVSSNYLENVRVESPERSFSPRSTSSRTSFTMHLEERDVVLKDLFNVKKNKEEILEEDTAQSQAHLHEIENKEREMKARLKEMTFRLVGEEGVVQVTGNKEHFEIPQIQGGRVLNGVLERMRRECQDEQLHLRAEASKSVHFKDPPELNWLQDIRQLEKELNLESMKKALRSLEEEKQIIESTMKIAGGGRKAGGGDLDDLRGNVEHKKKELIDKQDSLELLVKQRSLERKIDDLNKRIHRHKDGSQRDETMNEPTSLKEHKKNKVSLEKKLDEIDSIIHQYFYSMADEVKVTLNENKTSLDEDKLAALKEHLIDGNTFKTIKDELPGVQLKDLLAERTDTMNKLNEINKTMESFDKSNRKQEITAKLRECYEKERKLRNENKKLNYKKEILEKKLKQLTMTPNKEDEQAESRKILGENLHKVIFEPKSVLIDSTMNELKQYLEDQTLEVYINDLQSLSKWQNEQIEHLKQDLKMASSEKLRYEENTVVSENLQRLQDELHAASEMEENFKSKLGAELHEILKKGSKPSERTIIKTENSFENNLQRYMECAIKHGEIQTPSLQDLLQHSFQRIEDLTQAMETEKKRANELQSKYAEIEEKLTTQEDNLVLHESVEKLDSTTESHQDNVHAQRTHRMLKENLTLKQQYQNSRIQLEDLTLENEKLRRKFDETSESQSIREVSLLHEVESLKEDLTTSTERVNSLVECEQNLKTELENMRKKLRKASRDRNSIQENLELEMKSIGELQEEINILQQKERQSVSDMHQHCQVIERQEKDIKTSKDTIEQMENERKQLQRSLHEVKEKYQTLSNKHQNEVMKNNREIKTLKSKILQDTDLQTSSNHEMSIVQDEIKNLENQLESERDSKKMAITDYRQQLDISSQQIKALTSNVNEISGELKKSEGRMEEVLSENSALMSRIKTINEVHERDIVEARDELKLTFSKNIDTLNAKIQNLNKELVAVDKSNKDLQQTCDHLQTEIRNKDSRLQEQSIIIDGHKNTQAIKLLAITNELEGLKLENGDLQDQVLNLKQQIKTRQTVENANKELKTQKENLSHQYQRFTEEKALFQESVQDFLRKKSQEEQKTKQEEQQTSLKLLKSVQQERDGLSDELIKVNRELHLAKNDLRKLKMTLKETEQCVIDNQKSMVRLIEEKLARKLDEQGKQHQKEKERIMMVYHEERNKWEDEMKHIKTSLQEDTLKKLAEQRNDYEVELQNQIKLYLQHNEEELVEVRDKNVELERHRAGMMEQFEEDKKKAAQKFEAQRNAMVEIIKRLLKHMMMLKKQRARFEKNPYNLIKKN